MSNTKQQVFRPFYKDSRYFAPLSLDCSDLTGRVLCVVDTGAMYTCVSRSSLSNQNLNCTFTRRTITLKGLVDTAYVVYREMLVRNVTVGNINLGDRRIYITEDTRVRDCVIGMDLLGCLNMNQLAYSNEMTLSSSNTKQAVINSSNIIIALLNYFNERGIHDHNTFYSILEAFPKFPCMSEAEFRYQVEQALKYYNL